MTCECGRAAKAKGLCSKCYQRTRRMLGRFRRCSIRGCFQEAYSKGWCKTHHRHWLKKGDPIAVLQRAPHPKKPCRVPDCPNQTSAVQGQGFCSVHRSRLTLGLDLFTPITPGKPGRKPYVPGIPDDIRRGSTRGAYAYARGERPTANDMKAMRDYTRLLIAWRLQSRSRASQIARCEESTP